MTDGCDLSLCRFWQSF